MASVKDSAWAAFSKMIRLEASDEHGYCICVTCNVVAFWKEMDAGHFLAGRRSSIEYDERCVHPQCRGCNRGGCMHVNKYAASMNKERVAIRFTIFMMEKYGKDVVEELFWKRDNESVTRTNDDYRQIREDCDKRSKKALAERMIHEGD